MPRLAHTLDATNPDTVHHPTRNSGVVGNGICPGPGVLLRTVPWQELPHLEEHARACDRMNLMPWNPHSYYNRNSDTIND